MELHGLNIFRTSCNPPTEVQTMNQHARPSIIGYNPAFFILHCPSIHQFLTVMFFTLPEKWPFLFAREALARSCPLPLYLLSTCFSCNIVSPYGDAVSTHASVLYSCSVFDLSYILLIFLYLYIISTEYSGKYSKTFIH